eukprot:g35556.t1
MFISSELPILLKPRVCVLDKKDNEVFGFYLRAEKGKLGHIIRHVKPGSYAQHAGLFDSDRVLEVNGEYVDNTEHFKYYPKKSWRVLPNVLAIPQPTPEN